MPPNAASSLRIVSVDGRSGSGKTKFAAENYPHATVIHMDDLYAGWAGLLAAPGDLTRLVLAPLRAGERAAYQQFDWAAMAFGDEITVEPNGVLVIEGVGSSAPPGTEYYDERIWLSAPAPVRKARALARDGAMFAPHWDVWAAQEDALFPTDPPPWADLVIDTTADQ